MVDSASSKIGGSDLETIKFGPQWLRQNVQTKNPNAVATCTMAIPKYQLADYRYGREEMLALYDNSVLAPDPLCNIPVLHVPNMQLPLAVIPMTDEETRIWNSNINSDRYVAKIPNANSIHSTTTNSVSGVDRGSSGQSMRGHGISIPGRGRGRATFLHYSTARSFEDTPHLPTNSAFSRSRSIYDRNQNHSSVGERSWSERNGNHDYGERTSYNNGASAENGLSTSPRKEFGTNLRITSSRDDTNWRRRSIKEDDERWRAAKNDKLNRGSTFANWREGGGERDRDKENTDDMKDRRWISRRNNSTNRRQSESAKEDSLPEWATENAADVGGTFDSTGAFHRSNSVSDDDEVIKLQSNVKQKLVTEPGRKNEKDTKKIVRHDSDSVFDKNSDNRKKPSENNTNKNRSVNFKDGGVTIKEHNINSSNQSVDKPKIPSTDDNYSSRHNDTTAPTKLNDDKSVGKKQKQKISTLKDKSESSSKINNNTPKSENEHLKNHRSNAQNSNDGTTKVKDGNNASTAIVVNTNRQQHHDQISNDNIQQQQKQQRQNLQRESEQQQHLQHQSDQQQHLQHQSEQQQHLQHQSEQQQHLQHQSEQQKYLRNSNPQQKQINSGLSVTTQPKEEECHGMVVDMVSKIVADEDNAVIINERVNKWYYRDPQGVEQGPFSGSQMETWHKAGYFHIHMLVKRVYEHQYYPISDLIALKGNEPFKDISKDMFPSNIPRNSSANVPNIMANQTPVVTNNASSGVLGPENQPVVQSQQLQDLYFRNLLLRQQQDLCVQNTMNKLTQNENWSSLTTTDQQRLLAHHSNSQFPMQQNQSSLMSATGFLQQHQQQHQQPNIMNSSNSSKSNLLAGVKTLPQTNASVALLLNELQHQQQMFQQQQRSVQHQINLQESLPQQHPGLHAKTAMDVKVQPSVYQQPSHLVSMHHLTQQFQLNLIAANKTNQTTSVPSSALPPMLLGPNMQTSKPFAQTSDSTNVLSNDTKIRKNHQIGIPAESGAVAGENAIQNLLKVLASQENNQSKASEPLWKNATLATSNSNNSATTPKSNNGQFNAEHWLAQVGRVGPTSADGGLWTSGPIPSASTMKTEQQILDEFIKSEFKKKQLDERNRILHGLNNNNSGHTDAGLHDIIRQRQAEIQKQQMELLLIKQMSVLNKDSESVQKPTETLKLSDDLSRKLQQQLAEKTATQIAGKKSKKSAKAAKEKSADERDHVDDKKMNETKKEEKKSEKKKNDEIKRRQSEDEKKKSEQVMKEKKNEDNLKKEFEKKKKADENKKKEEEKKKKDEDAKKKEKEKKLKAEQENKTALDFLKLSTKQNTEQQVVLNNKKPTSAAGLLQKKGESEGELRKVDQQKRQEEALQRLHKQQLDAATHTKLLTMESQSIASIILPTKQQQQQQERTTENKQQKKSAAGKQNKNKEQNNNASGWAEQKKPLPVKSLAEIEAEERKELAKQKERERAELIQKKAQEEMAIAAAALQKAEEKKWAAAVKNPWSKDNNVGAESGAASTTTNNNSQQFVSSNQSTAAAKSMPSSNTVKKAPAGTALSGAGSKNGSKKDANRIPEKIVEDGLSKWGIGTLRKMLQPNLVDVPTLVGLLRDIKDPIEITDYVDEYLENRAEAYNFAKQFVQRRTKLLKAATAVEPQQSSVAANSASSKVAVATTISTSKIAASSSGNVANIKKKPTTGGEQKKSSSQSNMQNVQPKYTKKNNYVDQQAANLAAEAKSKKNKKKMMQIDNTILGFTVTAAADRLNVGDFDYGEEAK